MLTPWWLPFGTVAEISAPDLARALKGVAPPQLVDVRSAEEWADGHIDGALNSPILHLCTHLHEIHLDRRRPVVAVCLSGHRSIPAVRRLASAGYEARQLQGGMLAWRRAGLPQKRA